MYARNPRQRRIVLNNIAFGRRYGEFFAELRRWTAQAVPGHRPERPEPPREIRAYDPA